MVALWLLTGCDLNEHYSLNGGLKDHSFTKETLLPLLGKDMPSHLQDVLLRMLMREESRVTVEELVKEDLLE